MEKLNRRTFLKCVTIGSALCSLAPFITCSKSQKKPNILFLFTDDQRFNTIHGLGNTDIITPNMDKLVEEGTVFNRTYVMSGMSAAVCMPSRAMLMTGRTTFHLEDLGNSIPVEHQMLPELLKESGYSTYGTGKWHNGKESYARAFTNGGKILFGGMSSHYKIPLFDFDPSGEYLPEKKYTETDKHSSELYADEAIKFLKNVKKNNPFFMYVAFQAPHDPREMPQKFLDMYDPKKLPLPTNFLPEHPFDNGELDVRDEMLAGFPRTEEEVKKHLAAYYAMITHLDFEIGRILKELKDTGQYENTIIILAGDNGLAVGQHGLMGKQNLYEHSTRVPFMISGPGIPRGKKTEALCYLLDIYPTICELLDLKIPSTVEGKSMSTVIQGITETVRNELVLVYKNFQRAIITDSWKLILYNVYGQKHTQLFNIKNDPWEINNLAEDPNQNQRVKDLTDKMQKIAREAGDKVDFEKQDWGVPVIPSWRKLNNR